MRRRYYEQVRAEYQQRFSATILGSWQWCILASILACLDKKLAQA